MTVVRRDFDYGDVNRELRKVITKDANVQCVSEAIGCCSYLAAGLRAGYANTAKVWMLCCGVDWLEYWAGRCGTGSTSSQYITTNRS